MIPWHGARSLSTATLVIGLLSQHVAHAQPASFVNFETTPLHPVALGPDGRTLAVCNLPDYRVELFDVSSGVPQRIGDVPVGVDPVSVRWRTTNEFWVANHISRTISIVEVARRLIVDTVATLDGPADIAFAGSPVRAFVSCAKENTVQVFDPITRAVVTNLVIDGERPKAMGVSPDGSKVYVAIFESGNRSTVLAPDPPGLFNVPGPVGNSNGLYAGQNPPPNSDSGFNPPINPSIPTNVPVPRVSHIVKKNAAGRWMDDNQGDWTEFVSGANSAMSGRVEGWDLPDHDLAIIDTASLEVSYATGLMNLCMSLAVNPASGAIAVVGTDGTNERRFEPNLRGTFLRVNLALVNPLTREKTILDLNPHLDYAVANAPRSTRDQSIGDPRGVVWNANGTRAYVTGMGSRNLLVLDAGGHRVGSAPVELGEGPTGLALDDARARLYVLNRFSATLSVLDTTAMTVMTNVSFFDPTPAAIKSGRRHLYDTRRNSGLGQASCASCHPDARMDRLAWDLGDPSGNELLRTNVVNNQDHDFTYHPMKGPMVTQTLQDILRHEPLHWRGDRAGIEEFNQTFTRLLGADQELTATEMQQFKDFLATIHFPPNLYRNFDDTLSTNVPVSGQNLDLPDQEDDPLPYGNAVIGRESFFNTGDTSCSQCHFPPTGTGFESTNPIFPPGPNGERHVLLFSRDPANPTPFKPPQLRNLADKLGMTLTRTNSRAGFGFTHDGRVDSLGRFLISGGFHDQSSIGPDMIAFLLSFSTPIDDDALPFPFDFPTFAIVPSRDVAASVGKQLTLTNALEAPLLRQMLAVADSPSNRADLVVRGVKDGLNRGWVYDRVMDEFQSDRHGDVMPLLELLALASPTNPLTFTVVPRGSGWRFGVDRDEDGFFDLTELDLGFDPRNSVTHPTNRPPQLEQPPAGGAFPDQLFSFAMQAMDPDSPAQTLTFRLGASAPPGASIDPVRGLFTWTPPLGSDATTYRFGIQVTDNGSPPLVDQKELTLIVSEHGPVAILSIDLFESGTSIRFQAIPGKHYRLQYKGRLDDPVWTYTHHLPLLAVQSVEAFFDSPFTFYRQRFYRVALLD